MSPRPIVVGNAILPADGGETGGQGEGRTRTWTPWLVIPYAATDRGARAIPNGEVFWVSPYIWVESSDPWGNAVADEENFIHVRIFNLGKAPSIPTRVDFYWGDPSLGLGPGKMNYIGTEWPQLDPHRGTRVRCNTPWVPTFLNGGHECLMVQCIGPVLENLQGALIEPPYPLQPQIDRHVGQHNITVLHAKVQARLNFGVDVYNPFPLAAATRIMVRVQHVVVARAALGVMSHREIVGHVAAFDPRSRYRNAVVRDAQEVGGGRTGPQINARLSEHAAIVPSPGARAYLGRMLLAGETRASGECVNTRGDLTLHEGTLAAFENRRLELELGAPAGVQPGEFLVFHLIQTTADLAVGGYTIVVRLVPHGRQG